MILRSNNNRGYVIIILTILFASIGLVVVLGGATPVITHYASIKGSSYSKQSILIANSAINEAVYRLKTGKNLPNSLTLTLDTGSATVNTTATPQGKRIIVEGNKNNYRRTLLTEFIFGTGVSFHYGVQAGQGGFIMQNSSSVLGNIYSNGSIVGAGNWVYGDVISAGPTGLLDGIRATGTAFAHTIRNSTINKDAYYTTITNSTVHGISHPNSPDQPTVPMPISDEMIEEWKTWAEDTGAVECTNGKYSITSTMTIGPIKVPCNLEIKGNNIVVTIDGPIWVTGNITTQNGPILKASETLGVHSVPIIADNPADRTGSSIITLGQSTQFQIAGAGGKFIFLISQNNAAELGMDINAIDIGQSAGALVAYAGHGQVTLGQSVNIKEVTAYKIKLQNTAQVRYDSGLPSVLFESGPGGGYTLSRWSEI